MARALRRQSGHRRVIAVRRLTEAAYESLREIRLEALRLHPENFGADLDYEESFDRERWLARLSTAVTFGGFVDGNLAGIVVFSKSPRRKIGHTGEIGAMYVRAAHRGSGLSDALLEALIDHAVGVVEQLKLTVNAENTSAIKFYERHGFREIGRYPNSLRVGDRTYEELIMFRPVNASD
jgi:ribosomal protein S18 acetylase RimI-like enzyme